MLLPNHGYLCTKVLDIISSDYNLIHQWHFKSWSTNVRLHVLKVVLPKVQVCWVVTKHFQGSYSWKHKGPQHPVVSPTLYHTHYVHYSTITTSQTTPKFLSGDLTVPMKPGPIIYYVHCFYSNSTFTTQASTFTSYSMHLQHPSLVIQPTRCTNFSN